MPKIFASRSTVQMRSIVFSPRASTQYSPRVVSLSAMRFGVIV